MGNRGGVKAGAGDKDKVKRTNQKRMMMAATATTALLVPPAKRWLPRALPRRAIAGILVSAPSARYELLRVTSINCAAKWTAATTTHTMGMVALWRTGGGGLRRCCGL